LINHLLEKRAYRLEKQAERSWGETIGDPLSLIGGVATGVGGTNIYRKFELPQNSIYGDLKIKNVLDSAGTLGAEKPYNVADPKTQRLDFTTFKPKQKYEGVFGGAELTEADAAKLNEITAANRKARRQQAIENLTKAVKGVPKAHYATLLGGLGTLGAGSLMSGMGRAARERHDLEQAFQAGQASVPRRRLF
jgi:hypothetical protein